jgi:outer membrane protein assembly factor BamB
MGNVGEVQWQDQFDPAVAIAITTLGKKVFVVGDRRVAASNEDWLVRAYDARNGDLLWMDQFDLAGADDRAIAVVAQGNLVFVTGVVSTGTGGRTENLDWLVRAYDARTGSLIWEDQFGITGGFDLPFAIAAQANRVFVVGEGSTAVGSSASNLKWIVRAYDSRAGTLLWQDQFDLAGEGSVAFAVAAEMGRVFVAGGSNVGGAGDWIVRAYNADTGNLLWQDHFDLAGGLDDVSAIFAQGNQVFVAGGSINTAGNRDWIVRVYDARNGDLLWMDQFDLTGADDRVLAVVAQGNRVFTAGFAGSPSRDWLIRAYDARNGDLLWQDRFDLGQGIDMGHAITTQGNLVSAAGIVQTMAGDINWFVRTYDIRTGLLHWQDQIELNGESSGPNSIAANGNQVYACGTIGNDWLVRTYINK